MMGYFEVGGMFLSAKKGTCQAQQFFYLLLEQLPKRGN